MVERSKSERYLFIGSESTTTSEWRYARAEDPSLTFSLVAPREPAHEYQIEHLQERLVIRTNWQAQNFRIVEVPLALASRRAYWRDVVPHAPDVFVQDFEVFRDFIAINERCAVLLKIRIQRWGGAPLRYPYRFSVGPEVHQAFDAWCGILAQQMGKEVALDEALFRAVRITMAQAIA